MLVHGAFEKAKLYIEQQTEKSRAPGQNEQGICITISRQAGAGANTVSDHLIEILKPFRKRNTPEWTSFDKNLINKVIEDHHLPSVLASINEHSKFTAVSSIMMEMMAGNPDPWKLMHKIFETILHIAQIGNVIIIGRGSAYLTANFKNAFHVRLVSPFDERVKHVQTHYGLTHQKALEAVKTDDLERKQFVHKYFHKEIDDPNNYHLILNTHKLGYYFSAQIISCAVLKRFKDKFDDSIRDTH